MKTTLKLISALAVGAGVTLGLAWVANWMDVGRETLAFIVCAAAGVVAAFVVGVHLVDEN